MNNLTPIQKEIASALEQLKEKSLITEAALAKKVRENAKIQGKNKAGICLKDLEACIEYLAENNQLNFTLHLNAANDILIKKAGSDSDAAKTARQSVLSESSDSCAAKTSWKFLEGDAKKRRQSSEKSISVLTSGDLKEKGSNKSSGSKTAKKRTDRKKLNYRNFEDFEE